MADKKNQKDIKSVKLLPKFYQTDANKKFLHATIEQLIQPGTVKQVNGYIGRKNAKATIKSDVFVAEPTIDRQNYQLEPGLVIKDNLGNTTFFKDYADYINQLNVFNGDVKNHSRLNDQEFYSWDPHINWDKFINFQNYYWLPYGPDVINVAGQQQAITSTYEVIVEPQEGSNAYIFSPKGSVGLVRNPTIKLYKGQTYYFEINSPGNKFSIKTQRVGGSLGVYETPGLVNNSIESGIIEFTIPYNSPNLLYYVSESDIDLGGVFEVLSIDENTAINIEEEILGKKTYTLANGTSLSNGMKVRFIGKVTPENYETGFYYVEGVGNSINLVNEKTLELISQYTIDQAVLFDNTPFDSLPFSDATSFAGTPDYIVINRSSEDHNPWSRYNRWFHKDVIEKSAEFNGKVASIDQNARAVRPIIEFEANLRLFNFGTTAIDNVDLVDSFTTDVFSTIEGQLGYNIDGIDLAQDQRILFTADNDRFVKNKIFKVNFLILNGVRRIHLELDTEPQNDNTVLVKLGKNSQGKMYWYNSTDGWQLAQQKDTLNQPPLFDVIDENQISFGDRNYYDGSTFIGTKLFSYKVGSGTIDPNLGFSLTYKNINNIGDIVFNFNLTSDTFQYKDIAAVIDAKINNGFLIKTSKGSVEYVNGWQKCESTNIQAGVRVYKDTTLLNNFPIDIFDDKTDLEDLVIQVYVNGIRLDKVNLNNDPNWSIQETVTQKVLILENDITSNDVVSIRTFAKQPINKNGYYEIPVNLQNNPLNQDLVNLTLGEVIDHVNSIVENTPNFAGTNPGSNNIRDLGNVTRYGTKFVQHSGPLSLALYHITSEKNNVINAIEQAKNDYNKFKKNFITIAETLGVDGDPIKLVDLILQKINKDKPNNAPYYFSDMVPYGASKMHDHTVIDYRIKSYPLTETFNVDVLSNRSVIVYRTTNNVTEQLLYGIDYIFDPQGFVVISSELANDDIVTIYEYSDTNGSFIPATPTKLGLWPKYTPKKFTNTALVTPREMIQGHDGSLILAYNDYRDDLILEIEKRIYNNIKIQYDSNIFDIFDIIPGYYRNNDYSLTEFNTVLSPNFYKWTSLIDKDFTKPLNYDRLNPLTFNYRNHVAPDGREVPGYWRGIYRWILDTDTPNLTPWEILGFTEEPSWWNEVYGPAPYTRDNLILWQDLNDGIVREPGVPPTKLDKFARPGLIDHIPVDEVGNVVSPIESGLASGIITQSTEGDFVFGDGSPVESAWRTSSYYSFSIIITALLLKPAKTFGVLLDRSRIVKNLSDQLVYKDTGLRITPASVILPSIYSSLEIVYTSGIINYIIDYILSDNLKSYNSYRNDLDNLTSNISYRVSGFTSKDKFKFILDSKTPLSSSTVFIPQEDYDIVLNSSSPIKKVTYSGVIITKLEGGFEIKGYSKTQPFFKYYPWSRSGPTVNVGGISESYSIWTPGQYYGVGSIVKFESYYYRVIVAHTALTEINFDFYVRLASLPIIGGKEAIFRKGWDRTESLILPYGTKFREIQEVVDFLLGYGEWLKDEGFIFDEFNAKLNAITNWETSAKEFLFWTTQNWSTGEDKWVDWLPLQVVSYGTIVRYNGDYYRAIRTIEPTTIFDPEDYVKLEGLSTVGSSVISLSPSAVKLTLTTPLSVVDDIRNDFNNYEIFAVDGVPIKPNFLNSYREDNSVTYIPVEEDGIYCATFYLKQHEQVVLFNNTTMFNDTIYNPASGYRQERIRVTGYKTSSWDGSFNAPGFIFDQATISEWEAWKDYNLGDIVKYKEFYYSARTFLVGSETFVMSNWVKLDEKPTAQLLPNWSYKASQFEDFYSLDSDNFDSDQQTVAQHLIGYQKRQYLSNIIKNDVSEYKFYQGMITEKGTHNVLNKLFDVLSASDKESLDFYEEWAVRVGNYGASCAFENIEFILDKSKFKINPQGFELVNSEVSKLDFIIRQTPNEVYLKPLGYNSHPWTMQSTIQPYLRSSGYVRAADVSLILNSIEDILNEDPVNFNYGDYIWCGFENQSWNVYRYSDANLTVNGLSYSNDTLTVTVEGLVNLAVGDYIGIPEYSIRGFYKVQTVSLDTFTVSAILPNWDDAFDSYNSVILFKLTSQRVDSINNVDDIDVIGNGELLWTDNNGNNKWATWEYNKVFTEGSIPNVSPQQITVGSSLVTVNFGKSVLLNTDGNIAVISNTLGELITYDKASPLDDWKTRDTMSSPFISREVGGFQPTPLNLFGNVLSMSPNSNWLVVGVPLANAACTRYIGEWDELDLYVTENIVRYNEDYYEARPTLELQLTDNVTASAGSFVYQPDTEAYGYLEEAAVASNLIILSKTSVSSFNTSGNLIINNDSTPGTFNGTVRPVTITVVNDIPTNVIPSTNPGYWRKLYYVAVDSSGGENSLLDEQGVISIYDKDRNNIFTLVDTIVSPDPTDLERFGWSVATGDNIIAVGAIGKLTNTGIVYLMNYADRVEASAYYNPIGSLGQTIKVSKTLNIEEGMKVKGTGFESGQYVAKIVDGTTIILNAAPDSAPYGNLEFAVSKWSHFLTIESPGTTTEQFGYSIVMTKDASIIAISAPGTSTVGKVYIYTKSNNTYTLTQTIVGSDIKFGESITISDDGSYLAISSLLFDGLAASQGRVTVYTKVNGLYITNVNHSTYPPQNLTPISEKIDDVGSPLLFGTKISFMNDYKTIVVYSRDADTYKLKLFTDDTTFDNELTRFVELNADSGRIDIYDRYDNKWVYSETLESEVQESDNYGSGFSVGKNKVLVGAKTALDNSIASGKVFDYSKNNSAYSWKIIHEEGDKFDVSRIKRAYLYDKSKNTIVTYLDVINPIQGKIAGPADQEIKFKTFYDPAIYSIGTNVNVDEGMAWNRSYVGQLWWDLRTTKFIESQSTDVVYTNNTWNTLFPTSTVDIYEWVETSLLPSEWDELADTEEGLANGISGASLYSDDAYSIVKRYDNISKTFIELHYFWVKNKKTLPNLWDRKISAQDVSNLISNPRGEGYRYLGITGSNTFTLANVKPLLNSKDVVLSVEYWISNNNKQNIHSQWSIVNTSANSRIPPTIEKKWFDSLCGKDEFDRLVPDMDLPVKIRYGIENRPRQGMFINRFEALKQLFEHVNRLLIEKQITEQKDLTKLETYDAEPSTNTGLYDLVLDTDLELRFSSAGTFVNPSLTPILKNGRLTGINIIEKGKGYKYAPYIEVIGSGEGAVLRSKINESGQIIGVDIIQPGHGYDSNTVLIVRSYSVLVHTDTQANGGWSIYSYDVGTKVWSRIQSQSYDTRRYWVYVDWYDAGYNQFISYDHQVDTFVELSELSTNIGELVKVQTNNSGRWMILEKYNNSESIDWTQSYKVVGLQDGTIQFSSSIYDYIGSIYGYDGSLYDTEAFDIVASSEIRYILETLRDNILIDDLKSEYINLFFITIRYALTEQLNVDWIFKTSFIKAQHTVGELKQKVTYNNDNLADFEAYVSEVKPYRTQIREYVSSYTKLDNTNTSLTDFDLPPVYQNEKVSIIDTSIVNGEVFCDNNAITTYPWKFWLDNIGFSVTELRIVDGGSGYISEPVVRFESNSGEGVSARAFISNGKVNRILLKSSGNGYLSAPRVIIDGGLNDSGTAAKVVAIIGNSLVRSNLIRMKFDRITSTYFITQMTETEVFTGTGTRVQFPLTWAPDVRIGKTTVFINDVEELRDNYKLSIIKSTSKGYTSYSGSITFDIAPADNSTVVITYLKDWSILNAADRIQHYYNPATGELGKDLGQLMTGIDYGGAIVQGLDFEIGSGWDSLPYYNDKWDSFDSTVFDDYIVVVDAGTNTFELPYVPELGTEINVYYSKLIISSYVSDGNETKYLFDTDVVFPPIVEAVQTATTIGINESGQFTVVLQSSVGIEIGDIVTINPLVLNVIGFNTKVKTINGNTITLDQILFDDLSPGTSLVFTRRLITPTDCVVNKNGTVILKQPLVAGNVINISSPLRPVRIDDPNYETIDQTNDYAVMETWIGDGTDNTVTFETSNFIAVPEFSSGVQTGDKFILRKSTSDGSIAPQESDYDTALTGGDLAYNTATGLAAEDIIVDGDGFVTPFTSNAPEEVVPGQVVDSVAIKVYDRPLNGSANIKVDSYLADGITEIFNITQRINSNTAIIVKITDGINNGETESTIQTRGVDYTINYRNGTVQFNSAPVNGTIVSIFSFGFNGSNILDLNSKIGDGITREFITTAPWIDNFVFLIYVDGVPVVEPNIEIYNIENNISNINRIGIRFQTAPTEGSIVNYVFVSGTEQTFSITKSEIIPAIGALTYNLQNKAGVKLPIESNMLVRVDQQILQGPVNCYFTIKNNKRNYSLDKTKFLPHTIANNEIIVIADQTVLTQNSDYIIDSAGITIKINKTTYDQYVGKELIICIIKDAGYVYNPGIIPSITFTTAYNNAETIEVITSYNHDILDIQRTAINVTTTTSITPGTVEYYDYLKIKSGKILLDREVIDDQYVWVIKNGILLTPSIDFKLNVDRLSITLAREPNTNDSFVIMTYSTNVLTSGIAYMQFKDMLNRTHYKRLSQTKQTTLVEDLRYYDLIIKVEDASNFDLPNRLLNKPGVVEIRGERIEFFDVITENYVENNETRVIYVLGQLRRGTLGTGTPVIHRKGSFVQEIGPSETIPYNDNIITEQVISDGTNIVQLSFVPSKIDNNWNYDTGFVSTIPSGYGQSNDIEVFVGGYEITDNWESNSLYIIDKIVKIGSYTYRCIEEHTSSSAFNLDKNKWQFFAGNIRLKKSPYKIFNINENPESTEGDVQFDADFSVDGVSNEIRLTNLLTFGTQVTVIKKTGKEWDSILNIQNDNSKVANFLKATPGIWYTGIDKYESISGTASTFDGTTGTFDGISITFDQG